MFRRPRRAVTRVFIHCSASDHPEHSNAETIRLWHLARGFADIGYHYVTTAIASLFAWLVVKTVAQRRLPMSNFSR